MFESPVGDARASTISTLEAGGLCDYNARAATDAWASACGTTSAEARCAPRATDTGSVG
jgi:hypothetical protein